MGNGESEKKYHSVSPVKDFVQKVKGKVEGRLRGTYQTRYEKADRALTSEMTAREEAGNPMSPEELLKKNNKVERKWGWADKNRVTRMVGSVVILLSSLCNISHIF